MKRIVLDTKDLRKLVCLGTALDDNSKEYYKYEYNKVMFITYDKKFAQAIENNQIEYVQLNVKGIVAQIRHYVCKKIKLIRLKRKRIRLHLPKEILVSNVFNLKKAHIGAKFPLNTVKI